MFIFNEKYIKWITGCRFTGFIFCLFFLPLAFLTPHHASAQSQTTIQQTEPPADTLIYKVKAGDSLIKISKQFGNINFWKHLFEGNRDKIKDPDYIYPNQVLRIPSTVVQSEEYKNILKKTTDTLKAVKGSSADSSAILSRFRAAFEQVVDQEKEGREQDDDQKRRYSGLELGGMIINKTKSRMGSEFFYAFNDSWKSPEDAGNYLIEVNEQPSPSMGALISIRVNHHEVFKAKVHPRISLDKLVNYSKYMCYQYISENSSTQTNIY